MPLSVLIDGARLAHDGGDYEQALDSFRASLERIHAGEQPERAPQVLRWVARIHLDRSEYDDAYASFEASLVEAQALGRRQDAAAALNGMAAAEQFRGRIEIAAALYGRAGALAEAVGDAQLAALIDQNLGILANIRGDLGTALSRYQSALERFRQLDDEKGCACVLNNMGMLHVDIGEWTAAELCFNAAFQFAQRTCDQASAGQIEVNRAELHLKRQQYERARECCESAFRIFSQVGSDAGLGEVHKFYGVLYRETGKPGLARVQLNLALKLARSCENPLLEAETESERARLFMLERQHRQALQSLNRAHRLFCELDARHEILDLKRRLERMEQTWLLAVQLLADTEPLPEQACTERRGRRVAELAVTLAQATGYGNLLFLRIGALLHDVGNRVVPQHILEKRELLTSAEWHQIQEHTLFGDALVQELDFPSDVRSIVRNHHEHWDGSGYPDGLKGNEIPLPARIICIADSFDALTTDRAYRSAFSGAQALSIMASEAGTIFDPNLFRTFVDLVRTQHLPEQMNMTDDFKLAI